MKRVRGRWGGGEEGARERMWMSERERERERMNGFIVM